MPLTCINCGANLEPQFKACPHCGEPVTDFLRQYMQEPLDGKYRIISRLGRGGMGEVYKAEHVHLGAIRVIKVMRSHVAIDAEAHERFLREARLATRIHNTNVATLHDFSTLPDGSWYMVWEYIDGTNLTELLRKCGPLSPRRAATLSVQALMGLDAIHRSGIVHRDVSPDNIMIARDEHGDEQVKIIDLGIAKQGGETLDQQTRTGMFVGKWKYCSPEHLGLLPEGEKIDGRADLYSFGIVMYEMLTGAPPFISDTPQSYIAKHSRETPQPLRIVNPSIASAPELEAIIFRALEKDRNNRFATARDFAKELDRILPSLPDEPDPGIEATQRLSELPVTERGKGATMRTARPAAPTVRTHPQPAARTETAPQRTRTPLLIAIGVFVLLVAIVAVTYMLRSKPPSAPAETAPATVVAPATVAPPTVSSETTLTVSAPPLAAATTATQSAEPTATVAPPPKPAPRAVAPPTEPVTPPAQVAVKPAPSSRKGFPSDFVRPRKSFADSKEYRERTHQLAILPNYEALGPGDHVDWKWVAPGVSLVSHKVRISPFRDMSKPAGADAHRWLEQSMQELVDGVTEDASSGALTTENAIYWAEDDMSKKPRGVGVEMIFRDGDGNIVAMLRHLVRENNPADAAEEVAAAVADFVQDNE